MSADGRERETQKVGGAQARGRRKRYTQLGAHQVEHFPLLLHVASPRTALSAPVLATHEPTKKKGTWTITKIEPGAPAQERRHCYPWCCRRTPIAPLPRILALLSRSRRALDLQRPLWIVFHNLAATHTAHHYCVADHQKYTHKHARTVIIPPQPAHARGVTGSSPPPPITRTQHARG